MEVMFVNMLKLIILFKFIVSAMNPSIFFTF